MDYNRLCPHSPCFTLLSFHYSQPRNCGNCLAQKGHLPSNKFWIKFVPQTQLRIITKKTENLFFISISYHWMNLLTITPVLQHNDKILLFSVSEIISAGEILLWCCGQWLVQGVRTMGATDDVMIKYYNQGIYSGDTATSQSRGI